MDPKECLRLCSEALHEWTPGEAIAYLEHYREWRKRGGGEPTDCGPRNMAGDAYAEELQAILRFILQQHPTLPSLGDIVIARAINEAGRTPDAYYRVTILAPNTIWLKPVTPGAQPSVEDFVAVEIFWVVFKPESGANKHTRAH